MAWFRQRPTMVEALRFERAAEMVEWINNRGGTAQIVVHANSHHAIEIHTLDGTQTAYLGDWIIHQTDGAFFPCDLTSFVNNYEPV